MPSTPETPAARNARIHAEWHAIMLRRGGVCWGFAPESRKALHLRACWLLGYRDPLPYTASTEALWTEFERCEFTPADLRDVIQYREKCRRANKASYGTGLAALLADMGKFAEQLAAARKQQGPPRRDLDATEEIVQPMIGECGERGERRVEVPATTPEPQRVDASAYLSEWRKTFRNQSATQTTNPNASHENPENH